MDNYRELFVWAGVILLVVLLIVMGMWGFPKYGIYSKEMRGKARLKEAEWTKRVQIEEKKAELEAVEYEKKTTVKRAEATNLKIIEEAKGFAEAEITRAGGVAKANSVIGNSLKGNEAYLRYLFIQGLHDGSSEIIYVPTEANLPILEAARFRE